MEMDKDKFNGTDNLEDATGSCDAYEEICVNCTGSMVILQKLFDSELEEIDFEA